MRAELGNVECLRCGSFVKRQFFTRHVGSQECQDMAAYRLRDMVSPVRKRKSQPANVAALAGQFLRELQKRKAAHA